ncbi:hypothetical protein BN171_2220009 [Clostridioides difficile E25]|nr:hypothetical protein BN171_2220009 [Clostridioides difficile E25]CCL22254.1 hypothetical protein BN172_3000011 [Clostridioides difficile T15]
MPVGKVFDKGDVPVVACIGIVFGCGADFLQGVNHNEPAVGVFFQIILQLHDKTV